MKNSEKRAALLFAIECLRGQLGTLPADDGDNDNTITDTHRNAEPPPSTQDRAPFLGRPMFAKRGGVCSVCKGSVEQNSPIIYNGDLKAVAHARCGRDDGGRRR